MTQVRLYSSASLYHNEVQQSTYTMLMNGKPFERPTSSPIQGMTEQEYVRIRRHVELLVERAYYNLYNTSVPTGETTWYSSLISAAMHIRLDSRVRELSDAQLIQAYQDMILVSHELYSQAQKLWAQAMNTVYLREAAMDRFFSQPLAGDAPPNSVMNIVIEKGDALSRHPANEN